VNKLNKQQHCVSGVTNKEEGDTYSSYSRATICLLLTVDIVDLFNMPGL